MTLRREQWFRTATEVVKQLTAHIYKFKAVRFEPTQSDVRLLSCNFAEVLSKLVRCDLLKFFPTIICMLILHEKRSIAVPPG